MIPSLRQIPEKILGRLREDSFVLKNHLFKKGTLTARICALAASLVSVGSLANAHDGCPIHNATEPLIAFHVDKLIPQRLADWAKPGNIYPVDLSGSSDDNLFGYVSGIIEREVFNGLSPAHRRMLASAAENRRRGMPPVAMCFTPGMEPKAIAAFEEALWGEPGLNFRSQPRWTSAATTQPGPFSQGQPLTLTYSYVPDGTQISGAGGEPPGPSDIFADFNSTFGVGSPGIWQVHFTSVFDRWEQLTGLDFVFEPADDGAALGALFPGSLGVRGDIRISGHSIDGATGPNTLAYNFYPNTGDMVLDTDNMAYFGSSSNGYRPLRNVVGHENGHGIGMDHVCPMNNTKLMEPFLSTSFDGPQHDDVQLGNRHYGDPMERVLPSNNNDVAARAWSLGALGNGTILLQGASIDDNSDTDYYSFSVIAMKRITATVTPVGSTYLEGAQNGNGSCSAGTNFNSLAIQNLGIELIGTDGTTVIRSANAFAAGFAETIFPVNFPGGLAGTYYVRVVPGSTDSVQMYNLSITISDFINVSRDSESFD